MDKPTNTNRVKFERRVTEDCRKFPECYRVKYPDDPEVYCTCMDWSPEI